MKLISYAFLGIALFLVSLAGWFLFEEKKQRETRVNDSLVKAREAKSQKAEIRKIQGETDQAQKDLNELHNLVINNGSKEENQ